MRPTTRTLVLLLAALPGALSAQGSAGHRLGRAAGSGLRLDRVGRAADPAVEAALRARLERMAGEAGPGVRLAFTDDDPEVPLSESTRRRLLRAGVGPGRLEPADHLLIEAGERVAALVRPHDVPDLEEEIVRRAAMVALGFRPRVGLVVAGEPPGGYRRSLAIRTAGQVVVEAARPGGDFAVVAAVLVGEPGSDLEALIADRLAAGRAVALFLEVAPIDRDRVGERFTLAGQRLSLEADLAARGVLCPTEIVLDVDHCPRVTRLFEEEGRPVGRRVPLQYNFEVEAERPGPAPTRFWFAGPIESDPARLAAGGRRLRPLLSAAAASRRLSVERPADGYRFLQSLVDRTLGRPSPGPTHVAAVLEGPWTESGRSVDVLLVRDADFLVVGQPSPDALGQALADLAWRSASLRPGGDLPAFEEEELRIVDVATDAGRTRFVHNLGQWLVEVDGERYLADRRAVAGLLASLVAAARGPGGGPVEVVVHGDGPVFPARARIGAGPVEAAIDRVPIDVAPAAVRSVEVSSDEALHVFRRQGTGWRVESSSASAPEAARVDDLLVALGAARRQLGLVGAVAPDERLPEPDPTALAARGLPVPTTWIRVLAGDGRLRIVGATPGSDVVCVLPGPDAAAFVVYRLAGPPLEVLSGR